MLKNIKETESQLKALANRRRLAMLKFIERKEVASVSDIAEEIKLSFKSTSAHLLILFACGLVEREQSGTTVLYRLAKPSPIVLKTVLGIL